MEKKDNKPILAEISIRIIQQQDNPSLAQIIRSTLKEFGANHPGTVYYDESTDHLYEVFEQETRSVYYVAEWKNELVGGGGIFPSRGLPEDTCELVKMYLLPHVRGIGLGSKLIRSCLQFAGEAHFRRVYLETMPELKQALKTYEKFGFEYLDGPLGNTGHFGCELWMLMSLNH
jgi:putative acetyltransferase